MIRKSVSIISLVVVLGTLGALGMVVGLRKTAGTFTTSWKDNRRVITVGPRDSVQAAINAAQPGDTIVLQAGAVFKGNFVLPLKSGTGEIVIQSSRLSELSEKVRVNPSRSELFPKLQTTNQDPVVRTEAGAQYYRFEGIEFSTSDAGIKVYDLIRLGEGRQGQKTLSAVPHHLTFDRCYIHGVDTQNIQRGMSLNSSETIVSNSYIANIHGEGYDTQAICGWNGPGPFHIINNYLEASGENIMFGGADPGIDKLVPSDIEIRSNYVFKPLSWKVGHSTYAGKHWTVKNLLELKNARNVVIDGNVFENCWTDAQTGIPILFTVRNQEGTAPWSILENITFTNNIVRGAEGALNLLGSDNEKPSQRSSGALIANNLFTNIHGPFLILTGFNKVTLVHNTHFQSGSIMILTVPALGLVYRDNLTIRESTSYGVFGDATGEGLIALRKFAPDYTFSNNVLVAADPSIYPKDNSFPPTVDRVGFMNFGKGDYRLSTSSSFQKAASDGKQVGCDWQKLNFAAKPSE